MNIHLKSATVGLCLIAGAFSAGAAGAGAGAVCMSSCNERNTTCTTAGKSESTCLSAWHQCKVGCAAADKAPAKARVSSMPAPRVIKASTRG